MPKTLVNPEVFQDIETGIITEIYRISGKDIVFNWDGLPFKLNQFTLIIRHQGQQVEQVFLEIDRLPAVNVLQLGEVMPLPLDKETIKQAGSATLRLTLKPKAIQQFVNPHYLHITHLRDFLELRDDTGGHVILDFYFYTIDQLIL